MTDKIEKLLTSKNEDDVVLGIHLISKYKYEDIKAWFISKGEDRTKDISCNFATRIPRQPPPFGKYSLVYIEIYKDASIIVNKNYIYLLENFKSSLKKTHTL